MFCRKFCCSCFPFLCIRLQGPCKTRPRRKRKDGPKSSEGPKGPKGPYDINMIWTPDSGVKKVQWVLLVQKEFLETIIKDRFIGQFEKLGKVGLMGKNLKLAGSQFSQVKCGTGAKY